MLYGGSSMEATHQSSPVSLSSKRSICASNGVDMGQTRLFEWMRVNGYLMQSRGADWNAPTQRATDLGLFRIKESAVTHPGGSVFVGKTPMVTGKGQQYFVNHFLGKV